MSEFRAVSEAQHSPTICAFCGTHVGPFIDTQFELLAFGRVYVCMANDERSGCVRQMARFDGMADVELLDLALAEVASTKAEIDQLQAEIRDNRVVPMSEVLDELRRQRGGRPPKVPQQEVV